MESVFINGVRYIPEAVRQAEFFVCFNRAGRTDYFVHGVKQNLAALPEKQQVRVWCEDGIWHAESV